MQGYLKHKGKKRVDHGKHLIDVTFDKRTMHYLFEALAKYLESVSDPKEITEINTIIDELNKINDKMNEKVTS